MLETLPDGLEVEFQPITSAFLGTMEPLRFSDMAFFRDGDHALPSEKGATVTIYISEDR